MADDIDIQQSGEERARSNSVDPRCATKDCPNPAVDGLFCVECEKQWDVPEPEPETLVIDEVEVKCPVCGSANVKRERVEWASDHKQISRCKCKDCHKCFSYPPKKPPVPGVEIRKITTEKVEEIVCPKCSSENVGVARTRNEIPQYKCFDCGRLFKRKPYSRPWHKTVEENKDKRMEEIQDIVKEKHNQVLGEETVRGYFRRHRIHRKRQLRTDCVLNQPGVKQFILDNRGELHRVIEKRIKERFGLKICHGEVSRYLRSQGYGRGLGGKKAVEEPEPDATELLLDKSSSRKEKLIEDNLRADKEIGDGEIIERESEKPDSGRSDLDKIKEIIELADQVVDYKVRVSVEKKCFRKPLS